MHSKYTTLEGLHTRVTLYLKRTRFRGKETWNEKLEGSINEIFTTRVDRHGDLPYRILLLGAAGCGKTTTIDKLAYDWAIGAEDSPLQHVPLVFALKLNKVDKHCSLGQAIVTQVLAHIRGIMADEIEKFIKENENFCCILLDGYDEFSGRKKTVHSPPKKILAPTSLLELLNGTSFPNCRVLVTSRTYFAHHFERDDLFKEYAVMEIEGFAKEDAEQYIRKYFHSNPDKGQELINLAGRENSVDVLLQSPFMCMTLCTLCEYGYLASAKTLTKVFENIMLFLAEHAKTKPARPCESPDVIFSSENMKKVITRLGKVALKSLLCSNTKLNKRENTKLNEREFATEGCFNELQIAVRLGLVQTQKSKDLFEPLETCVEFYHKLSQEYCAGVYLANSNPPDIKSMLSHLETVEQLKSFENVLSFAAGSSTDLCIPILKHIRTINCQNSSSHHETVLSIIGESICGGGVIAPNLLTFFSAGSIVIEHVNSNIIRGLDKLPLIIKSQVTMIFDYCTFFFTKRGIIK